MSAIDEAVERVRWEDEVVRGSPGSAMARRASSELTQLRAQVRALTVARDEAVRVELEARAYKTGLERMAEFGHAWAIEVLEAGARARKGET